MAEIYSPHHETVNKPNRNGWVHTLGEIIGLNDLVHVTKELANHVGSVPEEVVRHLGGAAARSAQNPEQN